MDNHSNQEPTPAKDKWLATPILMAILTVGGIVGILMLLSGQCSCCEGKAKVDDHHQTEHHSGSGHHDDATHEDHDSDSDEAVTDSTATNDGALETEETELEHVEDDLHEEHE